MAKKLTSQLNIQITQRSREQIEDIKLKDGDPFPAIREVVANAIREMWFQTRKWPDIDWEAEEGDDADPDEECF